MGIRSRLAGIEVPIIGLDSLKWHQVSLPPSDSTSVPPSSAPIAPLTEDAASCSVISETYLIWRIHKDLPHALELLELGADKELPRNGLRIIFPDALCPFAFICKDEISRSQGNSYLLYTLTITGVAYILKLRNLSTYIPCSTIHKRDIVEFNLQTYPNFGEITAVGATPECLLVGKNDGSVCCFQLGMLDQSAQGFMHELRDEAGIGRLWGLMSRNRMPGAVQDLVISEVDGRKVVFVLHIDGVLRAWDLSSHCRIFCHTLSAPSLSGATSVKLWVGEEDCDTLMIHLAVLYVHSMELSMETVNIYGLHYRVGDKVNLLPEPSFRTIPLKDGGLIDMKITPNKIWILKEEGVISIDLVSESFNLEEAPYYALQEGYVADQLFQGSEQSLDELLLITQSIFSSAKDQIVPFVSSIFLRKLLNPGVYHDIVLRATLKDYNSHWTDSDFESLTVDGIKKEILSLIAHEVGSESLTSIVYGWKLFCTRYFQHWCKGSASYGLFIESSTGAVCLIRKHSLSLFRCLEDIELLIYGSFQEVGDVASPLLGLSDDGVQYDLLFEILQCVNNVSQRLGRAASAICYESLVHETTFPSEDFIPHIVKILETGYSSSLFIPQAAVNSWEKKVADHKAQRIFSVDMLLSLHALCNKATTWSIVLNAIESYLKFLVPRKVFQKFDSEVSFNINTSICVQSTSQISKVMFESAFDIHLLLCYLVSSSAQIYMTHNEISRIQLELIPMIQEIIAEWLIVHYIGTTPSQCTALEDFTTQLSSLQIGGNFDRRSWNEKLGKCNFTLSFVLLLNSKSTSAIERNSSMSLPNPQKCISSVHDFTSWVIWGKGTNGEEPSSSFRHTTELASILLRHGQYDAVEILLTVVDAHSRMEKTSESIQDSDGEWCSLFHLKGCTLLGRAHRGLHGLLKEQKISEAVHCFFRASAGQVVPEALLNMTQEAKSPNCRLVDRESIAAWKLHYYQWVMQIFEQYNISDGACQFALAALEQADEAYLQIDESHGEALSESASIIKGRLWANVFKFTLDLNRFYDAYCAIITNPDVESKYVCLRRFLIVLYERGALKILCDGELPFVDLSEKVEQELFWKAGRSDVSAKTNPYKLLYAFQMHRHNWRKAASYMYLYSAHLRAEAGTKDHYHQSIFLQERLNALSASINALQLVTPAHAWIDPHLEGSFMFDEHHPNKRAKTMIEEQPTGNNIPSQRHWIYIDVDKLESEYLLTSAENMLSLANVKWTYSAADKHILELMELLVQTDLYDMAFTVLLKFWKGSRMKSEMERVFQAIALKCIPGKLASSELIGTDFRNNGFMLTSSDNEATLNGSLDTSPSTQKSKRISQWEILELYLDQYKSYHARLPVIVAETLLRMDSQIELPLWLVQMFKNGRTESSWGMTGQESCPAALLRIYVDYGRYTEATNLVLEYIKLFTNVRPGKIIYRKRPFAVWFPYTSIERLWCQLEESISLGHKVEQCDKLKKLLQGALSSYLELVKVDSIDAQSFAGSQNQ